MRIMEMKPRGFARVLSVMLLTLASGFALAGTGDDVNFSRANQPLGPRGATSLTGPNQGSHVDIAMQFLVSKREMLQLSPSDVQDIELAQNVVNNATGGSHVHFSQNYNGLEIYNARSNVNVARDGSVISGYSNFYPKLDEIASGDALIDEHGAISAIAEHLGLSLEGRLTLLSSSSEADRAGVMSRGNIAERDIKIRLVYQPVNGKKLRMAWHVEIDVTGAPDFWAISVDAENGQVLYQHNYNISENFHPYTSPAPKAKKAPAPRIVKPVKPVAPMKTAALAPDSYEVFAWPLEYPNDGPRTIVVDPADPTTSPFGWHDTDGVAGPEFTITRGNNVNAYADRDSSNTPDAGSQPDAGASLDFTGALVAYDPADEPDQYIPAAVTNLFYWNNIIHDVCALHGFDEASGNFQTTNYGGQAVGNDEVNAEAQDGADTGSRNNANFATPPDGSRPRMQMFLWNTATPELDGDFSSMIIAHEYGHGVSNRLTGGGNNTSCLGNNEQMGEGWSDWLGLVLTADPSETGPTPRGVGTWALGEPVDGAGIRAARYSTDFAVNDFTYDRIKGTSGPHPLGHVWATIIWEVYWALVDEHGFNPNIYDDWDTGGNNLALRLVQDGMKNQPCSPGFVDGRDGILAADVALTGGANQCILWEAFARRGLGFSADQGSSSSRADGTEAFDLPVSCELLGLQTVEATSCAGTDAVYTMTMGGGFVAPVTLSASNNPTGSTVTFSPNPANAGDTVTMTVTTGGVDDGSSTIDLSATDGTTTANGSVTLNVFNYGPGVPELDTPSSDETGVSPRPTFTWIEGTTSSSCGSIDDFNNKLPNFGAGQNVLSLVTCLEQALGGGGPAPTSASASYSVQVDDDPAFGSPEAEMSVTGTSAVSSATLNTSTTYYWRVRAHNPCGDSDWSDGRAFTTGSLPSPILLVDDDDNTPDNLAAYEALLTQAGVAYTVWDTGAADNEPTAGDLANYEMVLWFTGDAFGAAVTGPGAAGETALATYLDGGGCLFMSSQDYHFARQLTPFMTGYLGVSSISNDTGQTTALGSTGSPFGGLGPYSLNYPFSNFSDTVVPGNGGVEAFTGNAGISATVKLAGTYSTVWTTFPLITVPTTAEQLEILLAFMGTCP